LTNFWRFLIVIGINTNAKGHMADMQEIGNHMTSSEGANGQNFAEGVAPEPMVVSGERGGISFVFTINVGNIVDRIKTEISHNSLETRVSSIADAILNSIEQALADADANAGVAMAPNPSAVPSAIP
jgi:hypothetical protein